jgi:hypothetical protein
MSAPQSVEKMRIAASPFSKNPASPRMGQPDDSSEHAEQEHGFEWVELIRIAFVAFVAIAVWFRVWDSHRFVKLVENDIPLRPDWVNQTRRRYVGEKADQHDHPASRPHAPVCQSLPRGVDNCCPLFPGIPEFCYGTIARPIRP